MDEKQYYPFNITSLKLLRVMLKTISKCLKVIHFIHKLITIKKICGTNIYCEEISIDN